MWNSIVSHPDVYLWCFSIGIIICAVSLHLLYRKILFLFRSETVKGKVINLNRIDDLAEDPRFSPRVEFIDLNGSRVVFNSRVSRGLSPFSIGDTVNVRYSRELPEKAYIVNFIELFFLELGLLILGLGWALLSFKNL